jgi:hypothetical protein
VAADVLVGEDEPAERPPAEGHAEQHADDLTADEVGGLLREQADGGHLQVEHVARDGQGGRVDGDADAADHEEQRGLVVALPAAARAEGPLTVEDVGDDRGHQHRDDLGRDRLGLEHRGLEQQEHRGVDDPRGAADQGELHQLAVPDRDVAVRLREDGQYRLDQRHLLDRARRWPARTRR